MDYSVAMKHDSQKGRLPTMRTLFLLLLLVILLGVWLWHSGYLPFRLRRDGVYGGNAPASNS
jgi:hypothetical protein